MDQKMATAPVRVSISVEAPIERAFVAFTEGIGTWWPLATHSIEADRVMTAAMEPRLGGRIVERHRDGTEANWGVITVWEPPRRLVFSWNPSYEDRPETEVEVTFTVEDGSTRVVLEHRGWEKLGAAGVEMREGYSKGWSHILIECYARSVA
jgi:uncharacterized protein YndB with AHSA1/START domain